MVEHKQGIAGPISGLGANLAVFVLVPVALNGVIFGLGWNRASEPMMGIPPGAVVGSIWVLLFAGMGWARWLLLRAGKGGAEWVSLLAFLCLLYPLYTAGLQNDEVGLVGNLVTAILGVVVVVIVWKRSRAAGLCVCAVCAWLFYAGAATAYNLAR